MTRLGKRDHSQTTQRVRDEITDARQHLFNAAEQGVNRLGDTSRHTRKMARDRARAATRALRGEHTASPARWIGTGMAMGVALGAALAAAGAFALRRWREPAAEAMKDTAGPAVDAVKDHSSQFAHRAADSARQTVARVKDAAHDLGKEAQDRAAEVANRTNGTRKRADGAASESHQSGGEKQG